MLLDDENMKSTARDGVSPVLHKQIKKANSIRCTCMDYERRHLYIFYRKKDVTTSKEWTPACVCFALLSHIQSRALCNKVEMLE